MRKFQINVKAFQRLNSTGRLDIGMSVFATICWVVWMAIEVVPLADGIVSIAVISGMTLGTAIGHMLRACYIKQIGEITVNEATRNVRVLREVRNTLARAGIDQMVEVKTSANSATTEDEAIAK